MIRLPAPARRPSIGATRRRAALAAATALLLGFTGAVLTPSATNPSPNGAVVAAPAPEPDARDVARRLAMPAFFGGADVRARDGEHAMLIRREGAAAVWNRYVAPALTTGQPSLASMTDGEPTVAELEALRAEVDRFYADLEAALSLVDDEKRLDLLEKLETARDGVADYSYEDLARLQLAFRAYPGFFNIGSYARQVMEGLQPSAVADDERSLSVPLQGIGPLPKLDVALPMAERTPPAPIPSTGPGQYGNCDGYGGSGTCSGCPPQPAGGIVTVFALQTAAFVAESVCSFLDGDVTIFGTPLPNPAKIICAIAYAAIQLTANAVEFANNLNEECEDDYHRHIEHAYLDATISSRTSQKSHDFHRLYTLRIAIENAMLEEADTRLGLFQLPRSEGGYLDAQDDVSVRYVVSDTIKTMELLNYDVRNAEDEYEAAEIHLAREEYKDAFARYRLAYRAAVRVGREP